MASPKRSLPSPDEDQPQLKRQRTESSEPIATKAGASPDVLSTTETPAQSSDQLDFSSFICSRSSLHGQARQGIQRSIAMVLNHDGFESATPEAMESFTQLVESYLTHIIHDTKWFSLNARRDAPVPTDYEKMLKRNNIAVSSLKPHLRHPIPANQTKPTYSDQVITLDDEMVTLPLLGPELSGQSDKDRLQHVPKSFPEFPSMHTYKFTPQEDISARDSQKTREQAARTAQQGEDALRRLVRASKLRKQKEVKSLVEKDEQGKERFRLWENTMKKFMGLDGQRDKPGQGEIADHSMIVNSDAAFSRREPSKLSRKGNNQSYAANQTNGNVA